MAMFAAWACPEAGDGTSEEMALVFDRGRSARLLLVPPLFDEHNKLRRQFVAIMRRLDEAGIDTVLPDLPGCNESLAPLIAQSLKSWRGAVRTAADRFAATHVFTARGGALLLPDGIGSLVYAPLSGARILRSMLRSRVLAARESGRHENAEQLLDEGRRNGLELGGWPLGPAMIGDLEGAEFDPTGQHVVLEPSQVGGPPLWSRAEPGEDAAQAQRLAEIITAYVRGTT